jgi:hypothetical protein
MADTLPGQRENWAKYVEERIIPFQVGKGMVVVTRIEATPKSVIQ